MIIEKCDKCKSDIVDKNTHYIMYLEEWDHNGYYRETPDTSIRARICLDCYKALWNDLNS